MAYPVFWECYGSPTTSLLDNRWPVPSIVIYYIQNQINCEIPNTAEISLLQNTHNVIIRTIVHAQLFVAELIMRPLGRTETKNHFDNVVASDAYTRSTHNDQL